MINKYGERNFILGQATAERLWEEGKEKNLTVFNSENKANQLVLAIICAAPILTVPKRRVKRPKDRIIVIKGAIKRLVIIPIRGSLLK